MPAQSCQSSLKCSATASLINLNLELVQARQVVKYHQGSRLIELWTQDCKYNFSHPFPHLKKVVNYINSIDCLYECEIHEEQIRKGTETHNTKNTTESQPMIVCHFRHNSTNAGRQKKVLTWVHCAMVPFACVLRPKPFLARNVKWFMARMQQCFLDDLTCLSQLLFSQIIQLWAEKSATCYILSKSSFCSWFKSHKRCAYGPGSGMCVPYQPHAWHPMISESWWRIWLHSISNFTQFHLRNSPTHSSTAPEKEVCKEKFWLQTVFSIIWHKYEVESCWCLPHY